MYLSKIIIKNFRKYDKLTLNLNKGLNVLIGENNSGKSSIIDAIKYLLGTHSNDQVIIDPEDFFFDGGKYASEFSIIGIVEDFSTEEGAAFIEYLNFLNNKPYLKLTLTAYIKNDRTYYDIYAGDVEDNDGYRMPAEIRDKLKTVFLRPLRDISNNFNQKRNSRLSQILSNFDDSLFHDNSYNDLVEIVNTANSEIMRKIKEVKQKSLINQEEETILSLINEIITFVSTSSTQEAGFKISEPSVKQILEKLSLSFGDLKEGLGVENLLFIATEFLLLKNSSYLGLKLALIEEIEAHLHPQTQLNLINYLVDNYSNGEQGQIIMTTHSPNIASKVNLNYIFLCKHNDVFKLDSENTKLDKGDYKFLERFLDVTKSNLFFARNLIFVEGDAENILLPTVSDILGISLEENGISIINVGSRAFLRYSKIFIRKDSKIINTKISIITDLDKKPEDEISLTNEQLDDKRKKIKKLYDNNDNVKTFISPHWTLEYCIALSSLNKLFLKSIYEAGKEENSNVNPDSEDKLEECQTKVDTFFITNKESSPEQIALKIYQEEMLDKKISKAIVAQRFANNLVGYENKEKLKEIIIKDPMFSYIVDAINHVSKVVEKQNE